MTKLLKGFFLLPIITFLFTSCTAEYRTVHNKDDISSKGDITSVTIVDNGTPTAVIVLSEQPTCSAQLAAAELQEHIRLMTGAELPLISEKDAIPSGSVPLYIGESGPTRLKGIISSSMSPQEYVVRITPDAIYMVGRDDSEFGPIDYERLGAWKGFSLYSRVGTLYAVYDFLEKKCGVRWYMVTDIGRVIPERKTLQVSLQDKRVRLWSSYRRVGRAGWPDPTDTGAFDLMGVRRYKKYAAARDNTLYALRTRYGGEPYAVNHSITGYHERFAKDHPDWWVDGVAGKSKQLRFHHPEVVAQVATDAKEYFSHPFTERQRGIKGQFSAAGDYFGVVPLDNRDYGEEAKPPLQPERRILGKSGSGRASNYIFTWVNNVAAEVAKVYPDVWISTIAYGDMFMPPDFPMEPNVAVSVCMVDGWEEGFGMDMLKEWRKKVSRLSTWNYHYSWGRFPILRPGEIARYIRTLREMGTFGFFMEVGDMGPAISHIDYTVATRSLIDRDVDIEKVLDEYYRLFYGPAEKPMRDFWTSLQETSAYVYKEELSRNLSWIKGATDERIALWERHLSEARSLAVKEPYSTRVKIISDVVMETIKKEAAEQKKIAEVPIPVIYIPKVSQPPVIDGKDNDAIWEKSAATAVFTGMGGEPIETKTYARIAYDDENIYMCIYLEEPSMDKQVLVHVTPSAGICMDDSVEINIDSSPNTPDYLQVMMNAGSVMWLWWRQKYPPNLTPDLGVVGKAQRGEKGWTAEITLPFEKISERPPTKGEEWRLNIMRNRLAGVKGRALSIWSATFASSFHIKERFGTIVFAGEGEQ
jgi:hypothetical protein